MSRKWVVTVFFALSALNAAGLVINFAAPVRASVAGMNFQHLINDKDFERAVNFIVEKCQVNVDIARLKC